jgi:hypothetical protein
MNNESSGSKCIHYISFPLDDSTQRTTLSVGDPTNNYHSKIRIHVKDFYNGYTVVTIPITVIISSI